MSDWDTTDFRDANYPSASKDVKIMMYKSGVKVNVGEFTDITWKVAPEMFDYKPSGTSKKVKVLTGTTVSGTLNRGFVGGELVDVIKSLYSGEMACRLPEFVTINAQYCFKRGANSIYKTLILKNVTLLDYDNTGSEGGETKEGQAFEAEDFDWI